MATSAPPSPVPAEPEPVLATRTEPAQAVLAFSPVELDFFRRGDELEHSPPPRPAPEAEPLWDWGAEATLTSTPVV